MLSLLAGAVDYAKSVRFYHAAFLVAVYVLYKIAYQLILWPRYLSPLRNVPGPPLGTVLGGQFPAILRREAGMLQLEWVKAYGPLVRAVGPLGIERLIVCNPDTLHKMLVSDWIEYPRPDFLRYILGFITGWGILTVTGDEHKQMRKAMNPAFSIQSLAAQTELYYEHIETLINILKSEIEDQADPSKGKKILMYEWTSKVSLDITCDTAFGYRTDCLGDSHNPLAVAYESLWNIQSGKNMALLISLLSTPGIKTLLASEWMYNHRQWLYNIPPLAPVGVLVQEMYRIRNIAQQMLRDKMREASTVASSDDVAKRDVMSLLIRARMNEKGDGYRLSDNAMVEQVLTFLSAGHETTASALAWALWLLASHPEAQSKLRIEVSQILTSDSRPDHRTLSKDMPYLDAVVMESLRVLSPVPMTFRQALRDDYIEGHFVPKGTLFYIPIRVYNTWKELWGEDAEEFKPQRWLDNPTLPSTLTFIQGPHNCIGKAMAIAEMKAVLAHLIMNFEFEPSYEGQVAKPTAAITMKPDDQMPLTVKVVYPSK